MQEKKHKEQTKFIWIDGQFIPWQQATVPFLTHSLHYADAVFEDLRAYNGHIFKAPEHFERLLKSAKILDMPLDLTIHDLDNLSTMLLVKNNLADAYIRPLVWRGCETIGIYSKDNTIHIGMAAWELSHTYFQDVIENGISLCWGNWLRPHPGTFPVMAKASALYTTAVLNKNRAKDKGFDDALFKDYRGYIADLSNANIFLVIRGEIHTPKPLSFIDGITRQTVIEIARRLGYNVYVHDILPSELDNADVQQRAFRMV